MWGIPASPFRGAFLCLSPDPQPILSCHQLCPTLGTGPARKVTLRLYLPLLPCRTTASGVRVMGLLAFHGVAAPTACCMFRSANSNTCATAFSSRKAGPMLPYFWDLKTILKAKPRRGFQVGFLTQSREGAKTQHGFLCVFAPSRLCVKNVTSR